MGGRGCDAVGHNTKSTYNSAWAVILFTGAFVPNRPAKPAYVPSEYEQF